MEGLIFDLDGTLIDSKRDIVLSVNQAFLRRNFLELPEETIAKEIGRGSGYLFRQLLGAAAFDGTIENLVNDFKEIYQHHLLDHTRIYPGVMEMLNHFKAFRKVIVTNKGQKFADRIVHALGLRTHFEEVFGAESFPTQKPDSGPILEVCRRWGIQPSEAVVIGDSQFDVRAGNSAGARTVGVLYGFSPLETFAFNPPDFTIESADQLIELFG
jgi:phosphoglycolate phosphatase